MDLSQKLRLLGKKIPREWKKKGIDVSNPFEQQKFKVEKVLSTGKIKGRFLDKKDLRKIGNLLESGAFDDRREEINKKYADKIDKAMTDIVREEISKGNLPDPIETIRNERDPSIKERLEKQLKGQI